LAKNNLVFQNVKASGTQQPTPGLIWRIWKGLESTGVALCIYKQQNFVQKA